MKWYKAFERPSVARTGIRARRWWACVILTGGILAGLATATVGNVNAAVAQERRAAQWYSHTQTVLLRAEQVDTTLNKMLRAQRGFVLTGSPVSYRVYRQTRTDYRRLSARLDRLTADNPIQQNHIRELERRVAALLATSEPVIQDALSGRTRDAIASLRTGNERLAMERVGALLDRIKAEERRLLDIREAKSRSAAAEIRRTGRTILILNGLFLVGLGVVAVALLRALAAKSSAEQAVRHSERQYRLLADNASDVILRTAETGHILYVSPSCVEMTGYEPDELVGRLPAEFIHPEDHAAVQAAHVGIVTGASEAATIEYRFLHKQKGWRWLESHVRPWRAPDDDDGGVISAIRDIQRRKELEADLVASRNAAESAVHAKASFLANMSHEIRTPMNGVIGFTELMLADELTPEQRRRAELIADCGRSMMRLLNDVLDLSKIEATQMTIAREPFNLPHAFQSCLRLVTPAMEKKGLRLSCELTDELPQLAIGDGLRLRQVVLNLLGNAAKFTERGSVVLAARVEQQGHEPQLIVEVRDTGVGIPADRQREIFDAFVQADTGVAARFGGTGLGLSISSRLARLMGGSLTVESEPGVGSTFRLELPLEIAEPVADLPETGRTEVATASEHADAWRGHRVLVAEDHDVNQQLIAEMLAQLGCRCDLAQDGEEAVALCKAAVERGEPYTLLLMDMQMPRLDGLAATRRLRSEGMDADQLPILALTANAYADDVAACLEAGMQAHIAKPVQLGALRTALRRWTGSGGSLDAQPAPRLSEGVRGRYRVRRQEVLAVVDGLGPSCDAHLTAQAIDLLHKLAGTAGMFGEAELGDRARDLEAMLLKGDFDREAESAVTALKAAA